MGSYEKFQGLGTVIGENDKEEVPYVRNYSNRW